MFWTVCPDNLGTVVLSIVHGGWFSWATHKLLPFIHCFLFNFCFMKTQMLANYHLSPCSNADVDMTMRMVGVPSDKIGLTLTSLSKNS